MKTITTTCLLCFLLWSCNGKSKEKKTNESDSTTSTDSISKMNSNPGTAIDETSSTFLMKAANGGMAEVEITSIAQQKAVNQPIKDFAAMLYHDHSLLNDQVKSLAAQKNVTLPDTMSADKRSMVDDLKKQSGKNFDKAFIELMIKNHNAGIEMFGQAGNDAKDPDVSNLAKNAVPTLRAHLDSALALQKKYWK